ncbi:hypothetical protein BASA81_003855 [Batrachochytrium salamandrivorans]|nr:hypothetical protein BASA81_003855 [Batrachochytrium salamandrivorans]
MAAAASSSLRPTTYNYVVSASRETVVDHCVSGSFTADGAVDTIASKGSRFEVRTLQDEEEKLVLVCSQLVFGKITCLKLLRNPQVSSTGSKEWLFVVTDRPHYFLFSFDNGKLVERGFGKLGEMLSKPVPVPLVVVDAKSRFALCHLFHGLLSVLVFDSRTGGVKESFITSLEELNVLDLEIVGSGGHTNRQVLCVLHEDNRDNRHVKTYELNAKNLREMIPGPWNQPHVEGTAHKLLAVLDGVLVFSSSSVVHLRESAASSLAFSASSSNAATAAVAGGGVPTNAVAVTKKVALITTIPIFFGKVEAVGYVERDGSRVLVGDESGSLYVLAISPHNFTMTIEFLGETSVATRLCYLDAGLVFVGSRLGDSQFIRLLAEANDQGSSVEVLETFTNLGPIAGMCLLGGNEKKGQLVTCSGGVKDGSLRIVRNGVGVDEQCQIDLPGILGMWGIKQDSQDECDQFLVQSFSNETRVLGFIKQDSSLEVVLGEMTPSDLFESHVPTLFCGNLGGDGLVQVTAMRVRFMRTSVLNDSASMQSDEFVDWPLPGNRRVTLASAFRGQSGEYLVLLGLTGGLVVVLNSQTKAIHMQVELEHQLSSACGMEQFVVVGLWSDLTLRVLDANTGKLLHSTAAASAAQEDALATSMVLCRFNVQIHLLVGYGDGRLLVYCLDETSGKFFSKRTIALGTLPVELTSFTDSITGSRYVFAACDRPSIVYSAPHAADKVLLSNVNIPMNSSSSSVSKIASFNSESFPNCLALASSESLVIGMVNDVQKIHVKSVPLGERPSRISHQPWSSTFGVCVHRAQNDLGDASGAGDNDDTGAFSEQCRLRLIDDRSFKVIDSFRFDETEIPFCILSTSFGNNTTELLDGKQYFVVGTAYTNEDDPEPSRGRILVFEVNKTSDSDADRKLFMVTEKIVKGGVYDLCILASGKLVAGVNAKIQVFSWTERSATTTTTTTVPPSSSSKNTNQDWLMQDASFHGHTLCLNVRAFGDYIVVGDLVKSVSLLLYDVKKNKLVEVSRALPPSWVTSLAVLEDTSFLISDTEGNLVVLRPDSGTVLPPAEGEESVLMAAGDFYWGDFVNCICLGSLTMPADEGEQLLVRAVPKLLFGTASGAIGVLATLTLSEFTLLNALQQAMDEVCVGVGMQKHSEWRAFRANGKTRSSRGFVDGDLVETLLELDLGDVDKVCAKVNLLLAVDATMEDKKVSAEELLRLVEDLTRLH